MSCVPFQVFGLEDVASNRVMAAEKSDDDHEITVKEIDRMIDKMNGLNDGFGKGSDKT